MAPVYLASLLKLKAVSRYNLRSQLVPVPLKLSMAFSAFTGRNVNSVKVSEIYVEIYLMTTFIAAIFKGISK